MGTRLDSSAEHYVSQCELFRKNMTGHLSSAKSSTSVATIAWMDYDAPGPGNYHGVFGTGLAETGSRRLAAFTEGLHNVQMMSGKDPHVTLMGHSYGSTTSGLAADKVKLGALDDLILFASPGSGVQSVNEYNITATPYVAGVPDGDAVQGMGTDGNFGKNPMLMPGFQHLSDQSPGGTSGLFGRHTLDTYWHPDSQILVDMVDVSVHNYGGAHQ